MATMELEAQLREQQENRKFIEALENKDPSLDILGELPPIDEIKEFHQKLKADGKLGFSEVWRDATGYYFLKLFLITKFAGEKAVFVKDVEAFQSMRFESARKAVARRLYERYVAEKNEEDEIDLVPRKLKYASTFELLKEEAHLKGKKTRAEVLEEKEDLTQPEFTLTRLPNPTGGLHIGSVNAIGVYGQSVSIVFQQIEAGRAPAHLFEEVYEEVMNDLMLDVFPRFLASPQCEKYIRTKAIEHQHVKIEDFETYRVLGRGGFGSVHAARKRNTGSMYAIKYVNKKLVKTKDALVNIMAERDVLCMIKSRFVTELKYATQDVDNLYLVMDLLLGGDLKFHIINEGRFSEERVRFYAAEILLGLEHLHSLDIIYRDLKLENVLLDDSGHVQLSDLGLAVVTTKPIRGYAGTPGYTAPEMVRNRHYGKSIDFFSYGVLIYRMLTGGSKPFRGRSAEDLDRAVVTKDPRFSREIFSDDATDLLTKLLEKRPERRLGSNGVQEIKDHQFFQTVDWGLMEAGYVDPPFVPKREVNAASVDDIGDFDHERLRTVTLGAQFERVVKRFDYTSPRAVQEELVLVLTKADGAIITGEKATPDAAASKATPKPSGKKCTIS